MILQLAFLIIIGVSTAFAIQCYQCQSTDLNHPFQCNEHLEDSDLQPLPCDPVYNAAFCIKQTGRFEGGLGTRRFCSSLDLGNYCNYIQQPGDTLDYRSCVYTCDTDGCNNSNVLNFSFVAVILCSLVLYLTNISLY